MHPALLQLAHAGDEVTTVDSFVDLVLPTMAQLVGGDTFGLNIVTATGEWTMFNDRLAVFPAAFLESLAARIVEHPCARHYFRTGDKGPTAISDITDRAVYGRSPIYQECYRPVGIEDQLHVVLEQGKTPVALTVNRGSTSFSSRDRRNADQVRVIATLLWRNVTTHQALESLISDPSMNVDQGKVVVDHESRIRAISSMAEELLISGSMKLRCGDIVRGPLGDWLAVMFRSSGPTAPFDLLTDAGRVTVHASRRTPGCPAVIVTVRRTSSTPGTLTPRQREVLELVREGLANRTIGRRLGISERTVKKHLELAYAVLGVQNRTAALRAFERAP